MIGLARESTKKCAETRNLARVYNYNLQRHSFYFFAGSFSHYIFGGFPANLVLVG